MIAFKYPYFLFAAFVILIPIIIHLFNFRRYKKVYFSNVSWLYNIQQDTKKTSQIRHLLILISRILTVLSLVIAFSGPFIPISNTVGNKSSSDNLISIYFDNSFSMNATGEEGNLLDIARQKSLDIISAYSHSDKFHFINNDFEGKHQRILTKEEVLEEIHMTNTSPTLRTVSDVLKRQNSATKEYFENYNVKYYLISDFQKSIVNFNKIKEDKRINVVLVPIEANETGNLYIDSCWMDVPVKLVGQTAIMKVRIYNDSPNDYEKIPVRLFVGENQRAISSFNINAHSYEVVELIYTLKKSGIHNGWVEISDHPVVYDDKFYFSQNVQDKISVLSLNNNKESIFLSSLFQNDSLVTYLNENINTIDYASISDNDLIILNELSEISSGLAGELSNFLYEGGVLLIIPSSRINTDSYNEFLDEISTISIGDIDSTETRIKSLIHTHELFNDVFEKQPKDIDYPNVFKHYRLKKPIKSTVESILVLQNEDGFLIHQPIKKGKLFIMSVPLDESFSNFQNNSIFVLSIYKMGIIGQGLSSLYSVIGENQPINLFKINKLKQENIRIKASIGNFEIIPEIRKSMFKYQVFSNNQIKEAGNYYLVSMSDYKIGLSFNYNRDESFLKYFNSNELSEMIENNGLKSFKIIKDSAISLKTSIKELNDGKPIWKLFILLSLVFILVEIILIKIHK